jgi:hypothetical protein
MKLRHLFNNTCFGSAGLLISGMLCAPVQAVVFQAENYNYYYDSTTISKKRWIPMAVLIWVGSPPMNGSPIAIW